MNEIANLAYVAGKFIKIVRPLPVKTEQEPDMHIDRFAPTSSAKGRHREFQSRRKALQNRR